MKYRKQADKKRDFIISLKTDQGLLQDKFPVLLEITFFVNKTAQRDFILKK